MPWQKTIGQIIRRKRNIVVFLGVVAALLILTVVISNSSTPAPVEVSNELVSNIQGGNSSAAYSLLSATAQTATSADVFDTLVNRIGPILSGKPKLISKEVSEQTGKVATAKVVYEIAGTDGRTYVFTVDLLKVVDQWKVLRLNSSRK